MGFMKNISMPMKRFAISLMELVMKMYFYCVVLLMCRSAIRMRDGFVALCQKEISLFFHRECIIGLHLEKPILHMRLGCLRIFQSGLLFIGRMGWNFLNERSISRELDWVKRVRQ